MPGIKILIFWARISKSTESDQIHIDTGDNAEWGE